MLYGISGCCSWRLHKLKYRTHRIGAGADKTWLKYLLTHFRKKNNKRYAGMNHYITSLIWWYFIYAFSTWASHVLIVYTRIKTFNFPFGIRQRLLKWKWKIKLSSTYVHLDVDCLKLYCWLTHFRRVLSQQNSLHIVKINRLDLGCKMFPQSPPTNQIQI